METPAPPPRAYFWSEIRRDFTSCFTGEGIHSMTECRGPYFRPLATRFMGGRLLVLLFFVSVDGRFRKEIPGGWQPVHGWGRDAPPAEGTLPGPLLMTVEIGFANFIFLKWKKVTAPARFCPQLVSVPCRSNNCSRTLQFQLFQHPRNNAVREVGPLAFALPLGAPPPPGPLAKRWATKGGILLGMAILR